VPPNHAHDCVLLEPTVDIRAFTCCRQCCENALRVTGGATVAARNYEHKAKSRLESIGLLPLTYERASKRHLIEQPFN
jgi:hypothetical protein